MAVLVHVVLVHLLLFKSLRTFGTVVGASVDSVDVKLFGMLVLALLMGHTTLTIPLGYLVLVNMSPVLFLTRFVGYQKVFGTHRTYARTRFQDKT